MREFPTDNLAKRNDDDTLENPSTEVAQKPLTLHLVKMN